jgi:hypothetical protein
VLSLLLSNWRSLNHCDAKLAALDVAEQLAPLLPVDVVLDRLVPYLVGGLFRLTFLGFDFCFSWLVDLCGRQSADGSVEFPGDLYENSAENSHNS